MLKLRRSLSRWRQAGVRRIVIRVNRQRHQRHHQTARSGCEDGCRRLNLGCCEEAQAVGGGMIARTVLVPTIRVRMMAGVRMRVMFMLVMLMNQACLLKQRV